MKFRWGFVLPLAVAQLVSWGSLYYAFAVIAGPMATEMGWSSPAINGALSAGLAATGFASFFAGRVIDAYGGRALMTAGSVAAALLLLAWSQVTELWQLYAVWIAMGATFSCVLYEPVFAVMARELKDDYRRGIITITLLGGLASTAFIPLTQFLVECFGLAPGPCGSCRHSNSFRNSCSLVCARKLQGNSCGPQGRRARGKGA